MVADGIDDSSEDESLSSTMIERDFIVAIERQQRLLAIRHASDAHVRQAQRRSGHWLSGRVANWWPTRRA
jgi:hypothetical protein